MYVFWCLNLGSSWMGLLPNIFKNMFKIRENIHVHMIRGCTVVCMIFLTAKQEKICKKTIIFTGAYVLNQLLKSNIFSPIDLVDIKLFNCSYMISYSSSIYILNAYQVKPCPLPKEEQDWKKPWSPPDQIWHINLMESWNIKYPTSVVNTFKMPI